MINSLLISLPVFEEEKNNISWQVREEGSHLTVNITANRKEKPILHWGVASGKDSGWQTPPRNIWPDETKDTNDGQAVQTPMIEEKNGRFSTSITIPNESNIIRIYFVLYFPKSRQWDNNHDQNYSILLKPISQAGLFTNKEQGSANQEQNACIQDQDQKELSTVFHMIIERENRRHWEMGMRLEFIQELLTDHPADESVLALIEIYLQYAALGFLPWQRNYNRQTYILAPKIKQLSLTLSEKASIYPQFLAIWRRMQKNLPSSGRDLQDIGKAIRVKILECKDHQNRNIYDSFMCEFHQKLHNASGPEDIAIAGAYLAFLNSKGDLQQYYQILLESGLAKKEKKGDQEVVISLMEQMGPNRSIHSLPSYIESKAENTKKIMQELLTLLEKFYQGMELEELINKIQPKDKVTPARDWQNLLDRKKRLRKQFSLPMALDTLKHLSDLRHQIKPHIVNFSLEQSRDLLLLDLALEDYAMALTNNLLNLLIESQRSSLLSIAHISLLQILLSHLSPSGLDYPEIPCLKQQLEQWSGRMHHHPDQSDMMDWCLQGKAIFDHLHRLLQKQVIAWVALYQSKAEALGKSLNLEPGTWQTFTEENVRAGWLFLISRLVTHAQQALRSMAQWPAMEVLVSGKVQGILTWHRDLKFSSFSNLTKPQIVLLENLQGDEDIPQGVTGIITQVSRDRISHFGIRAREQGVVWIYLSDEADYQKLRSYEGKWLELSATEGDFHYHTLEEPALTTSRNEQKKTIQLPEVTPAHCFTFLEPGQYELSTVGPKAYHLRLLKEKLMDRILVPDSLALPFGIFELILKQNPDLAQEYYKLTDLVEEKNLTDPENTFYNQLTRLQELILSMRFEENNLLAGLKETIRKRWEGSSLILRSSSNAEDLPGYSGAGLYESYPGVTLAELPSFLKKVWASKWTQRAASNRRKNLIPHESVHLAILIQPLIPADYAFVVHTRHPLTFDQNQIYIELVQGLGEVLVGGSEGQGYIFIYDKTSGEIKRSGFANKGYRFILVNGTIKKVLTDYTQDFLAGAKVGWEPFINKISQISMAIETAGDNQPQDIEGVIKGEDIYIVQTRPQIMRI